MHTPISCPNMVIGDPWLSIDTYKVLLGGGGGLGQDLLTF
jgi:hypothetical protein